MRQRLQWYHDNRGDISSLRLMAVTGHVLGAVSLLAGLTAMFMMNPAASVAITAGAGLIGAGEFAKAWQKQAESQDGILENDEMDTAGRRTGFGAGGEPQCGE